MDRCTLVRRLHYDPATGIFTWRVRCGSAQAGQRAGFFRKDGYRALRFDGKDRKEHRLVWLYCYGWLPEMDIDHRDHDRGNNRLSNLRLCTEGADGSSSNNQNRQGAQKNNALGLLGVIYVPDATQNPFMARITHDKKRRYIGCFPTAERAHAAYLEAKRKLHKFNTL